MQYRITKLILTGALCTLLSGCGPTMKFEKKDYRGVWVKQPLALGFKLSDEDVKKFEIREGIEGALVSCTSGLESGTDTFRENFVINISKAVTTPEALKEMIDELTAQMPMFKLIDQHQDASSTYVTFSYQSGAMVLRARTYFIQGEKTPISVTFTSTDQDFDRWLPHFEVLLADIKTREADLPAIPTPTPTPSGTPAATSSATPAASPSASGSPATTATPAVSAPPAASSTPAASGSATPSPSVAVPTPSK